MILADYHVHTTYCDGRNTPEETVLAAIHKGMSAIGFSGHSHTAFDESWCMSHAGTIAYRTEVARLREKYADRIMIYCGVEQDYYSDADTAGYDYVIGSVHYVQVDGDLIPIDESPEILKDAAKKYFAGNIYALIDTYFRTVADICTCTNCDIIGHFDLISKFNEDGTLFDYSAPQYIQSWKSAVDTLLTFRKPFEINTGAIARGYRTTPYPEGEIRSYIAGRGGSFVLSGDAHSADSLCFQFEKWHCDNIIDFKKTVKF